MADRYWVGGAGTWDTTTTTNWSAAAALSFTASCTGTALTTTGSPALVIGMTVRSSTYVSLGTITGGSGNSWTVSIGGTFASQTMSAATVGASVPTVADSVFFAQAGPYSITMTGSLACLDITVTGVNVTFTTATSPSLNVRGSMSLRNGTGFPAGIASVLFSSTATGRTITTNGVVLQNITFNGVGGGWTLGSALSTGTTVTLTAGSLATGNYNVTITGASLSITGSTTRSLSLGSSTVSISVGSLDATNKTNLTFNAGTSTINFSSSANLSGGNSSGGDNGLTFNNVTFTGGFSSVYGANTFNNLTFSGGGTLSFSDPQTVNGTFTSTGLTGPTKCRISSNETGMQFRLILNGPVSVADTTFQDTIIAGTAGSVSGTRVGTLGGCSGVISSPARTVYWVTAAGGSWATGNNFSGTIGGTANAIFFPLPQDTAVIVNTGLNASASIILNAAFIGTIDMSARTLAMTIAATSSPQNIYGSIINGSGTSYSGTQGLLLNGGGVQSITSAGKSFTMPITINSFGGTVQLNDALTITNVVTGLVLTNGTFDTRGFAVTVDILTSNNTNVRAMYLRSSTVTIAGASSTPLTFNPLNFTFDAGTSTITSSRSFNATFAFGGLTYNNVILQGNPATVAITGANTFNNLTLRCISSFNVFVRSTFTFNATTTVNGTFTASNTGSHRENRTTVNSATEHTRISINAASASFFAADFRDIQLGGAAAGTGGTSIGNNGNNLGITFSAAKTVYWNLAGTVSWHRGWATSSGGSPSSINLPLAQDTIIFNEAGAANTIQVGADVFVGTFNASARTTTTFSFSFSTQGISIYENFLPSSRITSAPTISFVGNANQTITSAGSTCISNINIRKPSGTVQLADAFVTSGVINISGGNTVSSIFDAVSYNVTAGSYNFPTAGTIRMGSGTWATTTSSNITVWNSGGSGLVVECGTSTILISYIVNSQSVDFISGGQSFNKLILGGTATLTSNNINFNDSGGSATPTFAEISSTKTRAHTIRFFSTRTYGIGKWSVTGTLGNVVTVRASTNASAFTLNIMGPATSGIDYLSVQDCTVDTTSPGEFYVGANSTNVSGNTRVIFTAPPAPRTLYWVGGAGNWSSTTKWSTSSGGPSGAAIPTSLDAVNFDSLSNATAYTATIDAGVTLARCASLTVAGPVTGNVTIAGTVGLASQGNISFAATGITRTWTGTLYLGGNTSGLTINSNGFFAGNNSCFLYGIGSSWSMSSALTVSIFSFEAAATFSTNNFAFSPTQFNFPTTGFSRGSPKTFNAGSSTISISVGGTFFDPGIATTFNAGTSTINGTQGSSISATNASSITLNNLNFTYTTTTNRTISGNYTFANLSISPTSATGVINATISNPITVTNTFTLNGASEIRRIFLRGPSNAPVALTVGTLSASNADFADITIAGTAAGTSVAGGGDGGNNTGIVFPAPKTVYWNLTGSQSWTATGWALTSGGTPAAANFPLLQDTAVFDDAGAATTVSTSASVPNVSNINASGRTLAMTLGLTTGSTAINFYGDLLVGTGVTLSSVTGVPTFVKRGTQSITSNGQTFQTGLTVSNVIGTLQLNDSLTATGPITLTSGTFTAGIYNVTSTTFVSNNSNTRTLNMGSGTWTLSSTGLIWNITTSTGLTLNKQTSNIVFANTTTSARSFAGGGLIYPKITIGGLTGTSTFTFTDSNNTFDEIASTKTVAHTISFGSTFQRFANWTVAGTSGNVVTVNGTSGFNPGRLIYTGSTNVDVNWLLPISIRAFNYSNTWYVGQNSVIAGTNQGLIFSSAPVNFGRFFLMFG